MKKTDKHYRCADCGHKWTLTAEQQFQLLRMTPVCPECGAITVAGGA